MSSIYPHQHDSKARVYRDKSGRLWIAHLELLEAGYRNIEDFGIVYLNGNFYELQAHAKEPDAWWVEEVYAGTPEAAPE